MERVELLTFVEEREGRRVPAEVRARIFTVRQLIDAVRAAPVDAAAAGGDADGRLPWATVLAAPPDPELTANLQRSKTMRAAVIWAALRCAAGVTSIVWGVRVRGCEHLPDDGSFIVSANHQTFFDGFLLAAALPFRAFRRIFFVGAAEFFEHPVMAWGARAINIVPLDPDANLVSAMRAAATGLRLGKVLILFPEGERTIDGTVKPFRKGAAILASHLDVPIVPVGLDGFWDVWPRGRSFNGRALLPWRAPRVTFTFGTPMRVAPGDYVRGTVELQSAVEQLTRASSGSV
jgi:long-chain acyl-CoA synthetase